MKRFLMIGAVLAGFVIGLIFSNIPAAHAKSATETWEYKCYLPKKLKADRITSELNQYGSEGWELQTMAHTRAYLLMCLKRQVK